MCTSPKLNAIAQGDVLAVLKSWPDAIVQTVVTSPPYWGLRDYKVAGQIGLESSVGEYVHKMVRVFGEVRRVLKKNGTIWVNLGDSYAGAAAGMQGKNGQRADRRIVDRAGLNKYSSGLKSKDLVGIPWRVALALQADGWYLRSDIIWSKPNPMPESVADRPTKAHEYIFLLTKSQRYFYDSEAIKEPLRDTSMTRLDKDVDGQQGSLRIESRADRPMKAVAKRPTGWGNTNEEKRSLQGRFDSKSFDPKMGGGGTSFPGHSGYTKADGTPICGTMANKKTVWTIPTQSFKEAHFATFPEDLIAPCVKAGSREGDVVLDPFMGAGTTAVVAKRFKRNWLGIELNPGYIEIANRRISVEEYPLLVE